MPASHVPSTEGRPYERPFKDHSFLSLILEKNEGSWTPTAQSACSPMDSCLILQQPSQFPIPRRAALLWLSILCCCLALINASQRPAISGPTLSKCRIRRAALRHPR